MFVHLNTWPIIKKYDFKDSCDGGKLLREEFVQTYTIAVKDMLQKIRKHAYDTNNKYTKQRKNRCYRMKMEKQIIQEKEFRQ